MGGPFKLVDHNGKIFTEKDLVGEFAILYFGFTHCPDICPDELEKLAEAIDSIGLAAQILQSCVDGAASCFLSFWILNCG